MSQYWVAIYIQNVRVSVTGTVVNLFVGRMAPPLIDTSEVPGCLCALFDYVLTLSSALLLIAM